MSYEGYELIFCGNGHLVDSRDCYDENDHLNCWCGNKERHMESIDQTNGCMCPQFNEDESYKLHKDCPAHSHVRENILKYDKKDCTCKNGKITITKNYTLDEKIEVDCPICKGTFKLDVPVYDISSINYRTT